MMHHLDALILRNALKRLDKALADLIKGGPVGATMAGLNIGWAKSDILSVLNTSRPPQHEEIE